MPRRFPSIYSSRAGGLLRRVNFWGRVDWCRAREGESSDSGSGSGSGSDLEMLVKGDRAEN